MTNNGSAMGPGPAPDQKPPASSQPPPPIETVTPPYPGIRTAVVLTLLFLVGQTVLSYSIYVFLEKIEKTLARPLFPMAMPYLFFVNVLVVVPILAWGWRRSGRPLRDAFGFYPAPAAAFVAVMPLLLGLQVLLSEWDNFSRTYLRLPDYTEYIIRCLPDQVFAYAVALVLIAPCTEELLFRGLFLGGFLRRYRPWRAIVVSALLFGLAHVNPAQVFPAFLIGIVLGWCFLRTGSLWLCLFGHAVNNAVPVLIVGLLRIPIRGYSTIPQPGVFQPMWLDACGMILFLVGAAAFHFMAPAQQGTGGESALKVAFRADSP